MPMQVRGKDQNPIVQVNRSRRGETEAKDRQVDITASNEGFLDKRQSLIQRFLLRRGRVRANLFAPENTAHEVGHYSRNEINAQFNSHNTTGLGVDLDQGGWSASAC